MAKPTSKAAVIVIAAIAICSVVSSSGCVYRLQPAIPPSNHRLRIIADSPQRYSIHVLFYDYAVSQDGTVDFKWGGFRGCSVYLVNTIPIRRVPNAAKEKNISVMLGPSVIRKLSLDEIAALPKDRESVPQLDLRAAHAGH